MIIVMEIRSKLYSLVHQKRACQARLIGLHEIEHQKGESELRGDQEEVLFIETCGGQNTEIK